MKGFLVMLKNNFKLVIRNKASILLMILIPFIATLILKIPIDRNDNQDLDIVRMPVIVFNNSNSPLSEKFLNELSENKIFNIELEEEKVNGIDEAKEKAKNLSNKTNINAYIYISNEFEDNMLNKENGKDIINVFTTGRDERIKLLDEDINIILSRYTKCATLTNSKEEFYKLVDKFDDEKIKEIRISTEEELNNIQKAQLANLGYLIGIMSVVLIFTGNIIVSILIDEKNNGILKRFELTKSNLFNYGLVKFVLMLIVILIQVLMIMVGIKLFVNLDLGISIINIGILMFGLALVLNCLSIAIGTIFENLTTSNYIAFFGTTIMTVLSGLTFPLDVTPQSMQNISMLMPQRWVMKTAEEIMLGNIEAVLLFGVVVVAYIALLSTVGALGLKFNNR